jgi:hypothetical protein
VAANGGAGHGRSWPEKQAGDDGGGSVIAYRRGTEEETERRGVCAFVSCA